MAYRPQYERQWSQTEVKPLVVPQVTQYDPTYGYRPVAPLPASDAKLVRLEARDAKLKQRIRQLRLISRSLAVFLSAATVVPLAMTLVKFFQTRDPYFSVDGEQRTAWAAETHTWYTYMYFGIALVSCVVDTLVLVFYCRGVKSANAVSQVAGYWSGALFVGHVVVWTISVAIYRYGKELVDGSFQNLWGWTCSTAAEELQSQLTNVNFSKYCTVQTTSFFTGVANVLTSMVSGLIYLLALLRIRSKKRIQKASIRAGQAREPLRY
ncbi:hypothetical protein LTR37_017363 [Vermiconidia calcicola]|uniref:Uncharacterized protein n=1 Tax=Vermiconidia calcicola TaxID=1690605 RepID=A0ACC3MKE8_9PEZI|nr:hypothetical protein LTR37_017363 [Vermiconidia calcicola]